MLCTNCFFDRVCPDCEKRYIVAAETDSKMVFFCFITYDGAKRCYDMIESTNEYGGFLFIPETAILLKPQKG